MVNKAAGIGSDKELTQGRPRVLLNNQHRQVGRVRADTSTDRAQRQNPGLVPRDPGLAGRDCCCRPTIRYLPCLHYLAILQIEKQQHRTVVDHVNTRQIDPVECSDALTSVPTKDTVPPHDP